MDDEPRMVRRQEVLPPEGQVGAVNTGAVRPYRYRHDGWSARKRQQFVEVLRREGSIRDAARAVGISKTSVTRLRDRDPEFDRLCEDALAALRPSLLETAYQRAVLGVAEPVFQGGKQVGTKVKYSDAMLRLLIDRGFDPARAEMQAEVPVIYDQTRQDEVTRELMRRLDEMARIKQRQEEKKQLGWAERMREEGWAP